MNKNILALLLVMMILLTSCGGDKSKENTGDEISANPAIDTPKNNSEEVDANKNSEDNSGENTEDSKEDESVQEVVEYDKAPMLMVDGDMYISTSKISYEPRCGNCDGEITSVVDSTMIPTKNDESNFGKFAYQLWGNDEIHVSIDGKWHIFKKINKNSSSAAVENTISFDEVMNRSSVVFIGKLDSYNSETKILTVQNVNTLAGYVEEKGNINVNVDIDYAEDDKTMLCVIFGERVSMGDYQYNLLAYAKVTDSDNGESVLEYSDNVSFPDNLASINTVDKLKNYLKNRKTGASSQKERPVQTIQIIDSDNESVIIPEESLNVMVKLVQTAVEENVECEKLKYLFTNQIFYVDEKRRDYHFRFLTPSLVESDKESMLLIEDGSMDDKCIKVSIDFYEEVKKIAEKTGANFKVD